MSEGAIDRRRVLKVLSAAGVGSAVFGRAILAAVADAPKITEDMIRQAEWVSGVPVNDAQRKMMLDGINDAGKGYEALRKVPIANDVPPAFIVDPTRIVKAEPRMAPSKTSTPPTVPLPSSQDEIAFAPVSRLSQWLKGKKISST